MENKLLLEDYFFDCSYTDLLQENVFNDLHSRAKALIKSYKELVKETGDAVEQYNIKKQEIKNGAKKLAGKYKQQMIKAFKSGDIKYLAKIFHHIGKDVMTYQQGFIGVVSTTKISFALFLTFSVYLVLSVFYYVIYAFLTGFLSGIIAPALIPLITIIIVSIFVAPWVREMGRVVAVKSRVGGSYFITFEIATLISLFFGIRRYDSLVQKSFAYNISITKWIILYGINFLSSVVANHIIKKGYLRFAENSSMFSAALRVMILSLFGGMFFVYNAFIDDPTTNTDDPLGKTLNSVKTISDKVKSSINITWDDINDTNGNSGGDIASGTADIVQQTPEDIMAKTVDKVMNSVSSTDDVYGAAKHTFDTLKTMGISSTETTAELVKLAKDNNLGIETVLKNVSDDPSFFVKYMMGKAGNFSDIFAGIDIIELSKQLSPDKFKKVVSALTMLSDGKADAATTMRYIDTIVGDKMVFNKLDTLVNLNTQAKEFSNTTPLPSSMMGVIGDKSQGLDSYPERVGRWLSATKDTYIDKDYDNDKVVRNIRRLVMPPNPSLNPMETLKVSSHVASEIFEKTKHLTQKEVRTETFSNFWSDFKRIGGGVISDFNKGMKD